MAIATTLVQQFPTARELAAWLTANKATINSVMFIRFDSGSNNWVVFYT